eukprot:TRINITY_DN9718_c0_g1_i1.p1 TRINITY_DN9718_c0_g1~~TRINITY_DN9718_c0_g1_i1.p1  ORF type:complete len:475 (+),score=99.39 TRINITY_DN9718_c0_g1_i1:32-1456(+)
MASQGNGHRRGVFSSADAHSLLEAGENELAAGSSSTPSSGSTCCHARSEHLDGASDEGAAFEEAKQKKQLGFASRRVGALVLANTLLGGSGMLGIPHALSVSGYALGLVFVLIFGSASAFGCHLLQCSARKIGTAPSSFYSVSNAVAPGCTWLIDGAVMIKCFGVATSYLIIVGDLAPDALRSFGLHGIQRWHAISAGWVVAGALACFKNLSALKYTAASSVLIVAWTIVLIALFVLRPSEQFQPCSGSQEALPCDHAAFEPVVLSQPLLLGKALPVFIFGFTCQQNIFAVCNEVKDTTKKRVDFIISCAYILAGTAFAVAALLGYVTYGDKVESDVLKGYPQSAVVEITRVLYSILVVFSYPLQIHPSRNSALALWNIVAPREEAAAGGWSYRWTLITVLELAGSLLIALSVTDLGNILGIVGATGSTTVSYILPGLVYIKAFPHSHAKRVFAFAQLVAGCIIMPVCLVLVFL